MMEEQIPTFSFTPQPVEGCDDCAWLTEAYEEATCCDECYEDQMEEMYKALEIWSSRPMVNFLH